MPNFRAIVFVVLACLYSLAEVRSQEPAPAAAPAATPGKKLTVLIKPVKPFVFERGGATVGYSIELWRRIAQEANLDFEFKSVATVPELIKGIEERKADVSVGAISITAEREAVIDFSHSYYESGLQILAPVQGGSSLLIALKKLFTMENMTLLGVLLLALILMSHLLWFFERRRNAELFPEKYVAGVWEATWWSICTAITGGCENIAPKGFLGRIVAIIWMLAGMALVATVTANLASTMTVDNLASDIKSVSDLQGKEVGTVGGTAAERYLATKGLKIRGYPNVEAACRGLAVGDVKAVVYDTPILRYYLGENPGTKLRLVGEMFEKQNYGIALQRQSPLRKEINRALLKLAEEGFFVELDKKWFPRTGE